MPDCPQAGPAAIQPPVPPVLSRYQELRERLGPRAGGVAAAIVLEALLLLALLSLGHGGTIAEPDQPRLTSIDFTDPPPPDEPPPAPAETPSSIVPTVEPPAPAPPVPPAETPPPGAQQPAPRTAIIPLTREEMQGADISNLPRRRPDAPSGPAYGPAAPGPSAGDSQVVGTAPDGSALFAARWYTEPTDQEMAGYLSTATFGSATISCRTAPGWRVEDCVGVSEHPAGSNMLRAVLAMAWQFRVRPPRRGNQSLVGGWVRIRIDYNDGRRSIR
ncbi:hypothetical protein M3P36_01150 [Altererythrobacter sp. KTW20L]|nr:hypothetical protein [Altererythrobacter sp. KTW20L]